jgi:CYTH domain-containing protein
VTLPPDIFSRAASEAVRRVALVLLDRVALAAAELEGERGENATDREAALVALQDALRRFDAQAFFVGARFGLGVGSADDRRSEDVAAWASRVRSPLGVMTIELDATEDAPSYGAALAGHLRWATAALLAASEARAEREAQRLSALVADLLFPLTASGDEATRAASDEVGRHLEGLGASDDEAARARLRDAVEQLARGLEARSEREVEHKYLLRAFPPRAASAPCEVLAQGYVPGERLHERLRRVESGAAVRYLRTIKMGSGLARLEVEEETSERIFEAMWPLTEGARIHKERYAVEDGALVWTIDRFLDRELVLAEVELPSADVAPAPPAWLAEHIVRDVTDEPAYVNLNLAR